MGVSTAFTLALIGTSAAQAFTIEDTVPLDQIAVSGERSLSSSQVSGTPLSGSTQSGGHTLNWTLSGASAPPSDLAYYDGVVKAGASLTFSGSLVYTIGAGGATILTQSASLTGTSGARFSDLVYGGTYTLPYTLSTIAPEPSKDSNPEIGEVIGSINASVSGRNCNYSGVCGGPSTTLSIAVVAGSSDTVAPKISVASSTKIYVKSTEKQAAGYGNVERFPLPMRLRMSDNTGKVKGTVVVFSDGTAVQKSTTGKYVKNGSYILRMKNPPSAPGPFYWCAQAVDRAGNYSKIKCKWLSIKVPISVLGVNGCGTAGYGPTAEWLQNYFGDVRSYGFAQDRTAVRLRNACNIHDAAYSGATIYDAIDKRYVDFRTWSRLKIDKKFRGDIRQMCRRELSQPKRMQDHLRTCENGIGITTLIASIPNLGLGVLEKSGATTYFEMVRSYGGVGFDANSTVAGIQPNKPASTFPKGGARSNG
jgi:hypothetical protein